MTADPIPLDRIFLDRLVVCPRSAMLRPFPGDDPELKSSPWWVRIASARLPMELDASHPPIVFRGFTVSGRVMCGNARIVARHDDGYGTTLILAGLDPLERASPAVAGGR